MAREAILHHVMIDSGDGGNRSVITKAGDYLLIPTPDSYVTEGFPTFEDSKKTFNGKRLVDFLSGVKIRTQVMHTDPENKTETYGVSPTNKIVNSILHYAKKGFIIFLGASMKLLENPNMYAKFIYKVFRFEGIYYRGFKTRPKLLEILQKRPDAQEIQKNRDYERIQENFHYKAFLRNWEVYSGEKDLFIITGIQSGVNKSVLLDKPIRVTKWNQGGILESPFSEWNMKQFLRGYSFIESKETVRKILEIIEGKKYHNHPDFTSGGYF